MNQLLRSLTSTVPPLLAIEKVASGQTRVLYVTPGHSATATHCARVAVDTTPEEAMGHLLEDNDRLALCVQEKGVGLAGAWLSVLNLSVGFIGRFDLIVTQLRQLEREAGANERQVIAAADRRRRERLLRRSAEIVGLLRAIHACEKRWTAQVERLERLRGYDVPTGDHALYARALAHHRLALGNITKLLKRESELRTVHDRLARWSELPPLPLIKQTADNE